jgi:plasmid replication initiation protein
MKKGITKNILLKQHNKVTEARYEMSALEKNIFYMLMAQIKDGVPPKKKYFVSIQELKQKLEEMGQEIDAPLLLEATGKLVTRVYEFDEPSGDYVQMTLFASVLYRYDNDSIEIELSKSIRPYLFELEFDFTAYQLDSALSLVSDYSKRIYEMLSQHKEVGIFRISVLKLKEKLKTIDTATKIDKHKMWSSFSRDVLELSRKEINKKTDISFDYVLHKTGRKYTDIVFHIMKREVSVPKEGMKTQLELGL